MARFFISLMIELEFRVTKQCSAKRIMRAISLITCLLSLGISGCTPDERHDRDADLIHIFHDQRATFDELLAMIHEDQELERVDYNWTLPDPPPISRERLELYRTLLTSIGCVRGFENFKTKSEIIFIASSCGMVTGGSSKGYYFSQNQPSPIVDDLDAYRPEDSRTYAAFRHLEGNWYLILNMMTK